MSPTPEAATLVPALDAEPLMDRNPLRIAIELTKARLNSLVLVTTAVGFLLGEPRLFDWRLLGWTLLGTALAAASAAMLNQLLEVRRDGMMRRTQGRPLPSGRVGKAPVFVLGILAGYLGVFVLAVSVNLTAAGLAFANILLYTLVYTPLKPVTTLNTLIGAITGAIPPMIGWAAVTGGLHIGAWILGAILFIWQMPHFLALAWMYREDYRRGGMSMLPVVDPSGELTARTMVITSLLLVPFGVSTTLFGVTGVYSAAANFLLALGMAALAFRFYLDRSDRKARKVFFASIIYLPIALGVMVLDRGPISPEYWLRGGRTSFDITTPERPALEVGL